MPPTSECLLFTVATLSGVRRRRLELGGPTGGEIVDAGAVVLGGAAGALTVPTLMLLLLSSGWDSTVTELRFSRCDSLEDLFFLKGLKNTTISSTF